MNNHIQLVLKSSTTELPLNDREYGIYLVPELEGLTGLPEIRTTSGVNAGYDGGWTSAQNYDARSITIRGVIANTDVATVERLRRQLTALAGQGKKEELTLDLVTEAGNAYTVQVRTIALEMALQKVVYQQEFMLQLRADDPLIYDASETGHEALLQVAQATGGFTIGFELPLAITGSSEETVVNNEGLEQVPTITRMYGALHNPKIINQTTNQFMQIEADLGFAEGDWIEPSEVVSGKDITINGAPEGAPLSSVQIDGNTTQQTYSGKNLAGIPSTTVNGITCTRLADGGYSLNGRATGNAQFIFDYSLENTAHTISCTINTPNVGIYFRTRVYQEDGYGTIVDGVQMNATTRSVTSSKSFGQVMITVGSSVTLSNCIVYPQLELGSTATAFEPYVGGVPAPNPDYPQAVRTVTGENVVKICGKNLLEMPIESGSSNGITWAVQDDGSIILNGTSTAGVSIRANNVTMPAVEGETYTLSAAGMGEAYNFGYKNSGSGANIFVVTSASPTTTAVVTSTMLSQANRLDMYIQPGKTFNNQRVTLQLEKGSSASSFEPYQGQSYEVNLGKNLFDKDTMTLSNVSINPNINSANGFTSVYIPCEPNTIYTVQKAQETTRFYVVTTEEIPAPGVQGTAISSSTGGTVKTFTTGASARYIAVMVRSTSDTLTEAEVVAGIQIEKGSQATSYAAYFEPIELCKIGTYQDSIYKSGDKWYLRKECGKLVVNGSETGWLISASTGSPNYYYARTDAKDGISVSKYAENYCNNLTNRGIYIQGTDVVNTDVFSLGSPSYSLRMLILGSRLSAMTTAALSTWLAANTPTIYYATATPTDTEITNEALVAQLEALAAATMYNPQTNITTLYADGNEQPTLDVSYFTDKNPDTRDELVIDSRLRTITLNGLDVYHLQAPGSEFLMLAPGENRLALQSDITGDNGYAQVSYKQGYLSI